MRAILVGGAALAVATESDKSGAAAARSRPLFTARPMSNTELQAVIPQEPDFASLEDLERNCRGASFRVSSGDTLTLEDFRQLALGFYSSGAPVLAYSAVHSAILSLKSMVSSACPQAVMQALLLHMEALLVDIYTRSGQSREQQLSSFRESAAVHAEYVALERWLRGVFGGAPPPDLGWPLERGFGRVQRYYDMLWEDVHDSEDTWSIMEQPGEISDELYHAALDDVAAVLGALDVEWWPCRGTLIALLRHGRRSGLLSGGLLDVVERDIDVMLGVQDEADWQWIGEAIERKLREKGWDRCWSKTSAEHGSPFRDVVRKDLLYCVRTSPAYMLLDVTSYVAGAPGPHVFVHRVCGAAASTCADGACGAAPASFDAGQGCVVPGGLGPLRPGGGLLRKESIYPFAKCLAGDITVPCPRRPLDTIHAMVHSGLEAGCIALPTVCGRDPEDPWTRRLAEVGLRGEDVWLLRERSAGLDVMGFQSMTPYFENCSILEKVMSRIS